jgi:hypothetical protein
LQHQGIRGIHALVQAGDKEKTEQQRKMGDSQMEVCGLDFERENVMPIGEECVISGRMPSSRKYAYAHSQLRGICLDDLPKKAKATTK